MNDTKFLPHGHISYKNYDEINKYMIQCQVVFVAMKKNKSILGIESIVWELFEVV